VARRDIFPLNAAREPFFVKMWPAYETEFETPALGVTALRGGDKDFCDNSTKASILKTVMIGQGVKNCQKLSN